MGWSFESTTDGQPRARALRPWRTAGASWRGGRVTAIGETTITISLRAEQSATLNYTIARALFPAATINGACVCRIANLALSTALTDYLIAEVRGARFVGLMEHSAQFPNWGHVEYETTGESRFWDE